MNIKQFDVRNLLLISCMFFSSCGVRFDGQPARSYLTDYDDVIDLLAAIVLGFIAIIVSLIAFHKQQKQRSIKKEFQREILLDIIWRFYSAKIWIVAIKWNLQKKGYGNNYPSDTYFTRLKIPNRYTEILVNNFNIPKKYDKLLALSLRIDEFNQWCDLTMKHGQMKNLKENQKENKWNTLEYKSSIIAKQTIDLMYELNLATERTIQDFFRKKFGKVLHRNSPDIELLNKLKRREIDTVFDTELNLSDYMNEAIAWEIPKIELIEKEI